MLSKLLKYEFKDTARIIPFIYLIILVFAGIMLSGKQLNVAVFTTTSSVILMLLGISLMIVTFVVIAIRFYKNIYGNEGYLMFTLPVKPHELLLSKAIAAFTWMIISYGFTFGAIYTSLYGFGVTGELPFIWKEISKYGLEKIIYFIIPMSLIGILYILGQMFFAITLANRPAFHSMGLAASFLLFIATYIILNLVESTFTILIPLSIEINFTDKITMAFSNKNMFGFLMESMKASHGSNLDSMIVGLGGYVFIAIMTFMLYFITARMMKNKVSLK